MQSVLESKQSVEASRRKQDIKNALSATRTMNLEATSSVVDSGRVRRKKKASSPGKD